MPCPGFCVCANKREPMNSAEFHFHGGASSPLEGESRARLYPAVNPSRSLPLPHHPHNNTVGPLSRSRKPACLSSASSGWPPHTACSDAVDLPHRPWSLVSPRIERIPTCGTGKGGGKKSRTRTELDPDELLVACSRHQHGGCNGHHTLMESLNLACLRPPTPSSSGLVVAGRRHLALFIPSYFGAGV